MMIVTRLLSLALVLAAATAAADPKKPLKDYQLQNALDANGQAITGLPAPSAANDAVRKTYVDTTFAPKNFPLLDRPTILGTMTGDGGNWEIQDDGTATFKSVTASTGDFSTINLDGVSLATLLEAKAANAPATASEAGLQKAPGLIVVTGTSIDESYMPPAGVGNDWPTILLAKTGWAGRANLINNAIASETYVNIAAQVANLDVNLVVTPGAGLVILGSPFNDINAGASAATIEGYLTTVINAYKARGFLVMMMTVPHVGNLSAPKLAERATLNAWMLAQEGVTVEYVVDISSSVTESDTIDSTHPTASANDAKFAQAIVAKLATPWPAQLLPARSWQGTETITRQTLFSPGLDVRTPAAAYNRESDTAATRATGLRMDGVNYFPFSFPAGQGLYVGDSGQCIATLGSSISLTGDFFVGFWIRPTSRVFQSGSNTAPLLTSASTASFALAGETGKPYFYDGATNYLFSGVPAVPSDGSPCFVAWRRAGGLLRACVNGVWGEALSYSATISIDRLFGRAAGSYYQGDVYRVIVKTGAWDYRQIERWMRGAGAELSGGTSTGLWLEFREGGGLVSYDLRGGAAMVNATITTAANTFYWLWPARSGLAGVSADNGDAAATLTVGSSPVTQRWATPLTADRAVTLSTASAQSGSKFHLVREATATGASNLNVGIGPLKALAAGTWCDVTFSGSGWVLTASGSL